MEKNFDTLLRIDALLSEILDRYLVYICLTSVTRAKPKEKWNFPLNCRNGINWTSPFLLNIHNAINWAGAFSKAFSSSEALISVLSKNAYLYDNISNSFQSKTLYIVVIFKWSHLDTNLWICNLCICQKICQQNTNIWYNGSGIQKILQKAVQVSPLH